MKSKVSIFWFRRDLRLEDNVGLYHALSSGFPVVPIFIFDENILAKFEDKKDRRVDYISQVLYKINTQLKSHETRLNVFYGNPIEIFNMLYKKHFIQAVFCNRDYEPLAIQRDIDIYEFFKRKGISFRAFKDQVIFDKSDVLKNNGDSYTVYTPYSKKWKEILSREDLKSYDPDYNKFFRQKFAEIPSLNDFGFEKTDIIFEVPKLATKTINEYDRFRDYPAMECTTHLGIALRFGTISIRKCVAFALCHNQVWLNELIWREFFMQILYHFPKVVNQSFKSKYDNIKWRNNEREFKKWCEGITGFPIVDAGMRQLNQTGYMHNRVRMIAASFLCKDLLIDWRWGEAYFAQKLNDFDLSSNNGNWQWVSGSGCDAAPYFRMLNPSLQMQKYDKNLEYVRKWLPELDTENYPNPIIDHAIAKKRALKIYREALEQK